MLLGIEKKYIYIYILLIIEHNGDASAESCLGNYKTFDCHSG
jgi:hypothetical protein